MSGLPTKFYPPFLVEPCTRIPRPIRNWLGSLLLGPPSGPRIREREACVLALGRIGDFVLSLPAFRLFAREFGADQVVLVVTPGVAGLAAAELPGVELIVLPQEANGLLREVLPTWRRDRPKFASTRFKRRITLNHYRSFYQELAWSWIDAAQDFRLVPDETYPATMRDGQCRELQGHQLLTSQVLGRPVAWEEIVPAFPNIAATDHGRLLVYPLSHDGTKNVSVEKIAAVLRAWRTRSQASIVLGGSPRDTAVLESYAAACRATGVDRVTVECPAGVPAFIAHLAAAGAVIAAESAAGHVAAAFDKPSVVLVARDWYGLSQPWSKSARQHAFLIETPDAEIASALPILSLSS